VSNLSDDLIKTIFDIAKVGAQKYVAQPDPISCDDCGRVATESWACPAPLLAIHLCESCADKRRDRYYEWPHHDLPRAEND
jgi:hypothetical protein